MASATATAAVAAWANGLADGCGDGPARRAPVALAARHPTRAPGAGRGAGASYHHQQLAGALRQRNAEKEAAAVAAQYGCCCYVCGGVWVGASSWRLSIVILPQRLAWTSAQTEVTSAKCRALPAAVGTHLNLGLGWLTAHLQDCPGGIPEGARGGGAAWSWGPRTGKPPPLLLSTSRMLSKTIPPHQ